MILGFLAFTVWAATQADTWERIASGAIHHRPNAEQLLHMVEQVHMQLFMAMVLCFFSMSIAIHRTVKYQARLRMAHGNRLKNRSKLPDVKSSVSDVSDEFISTF